MDYEKLHKDTITKLQEMVNSGKITAEIARGICADFVPESEDEKIRKSLFEYFKNRKEDGDEDETWYGISYDDILTWFEKQGEYKQMLDDLPKDDDYGIDGLWHAQRILEKTLGCVDGYQSDEGILEHKCAISAVKNLYEQKYLQRKHKTVNFK